MIGTDRMSLRGSSICKQDDWRAVMGWIPGGEAFLGIAWKECLFVLLCTPFVRF